MPATARLVMDPKGVDAMLAQAGVGEYLHTVAEAGAEYARSVAPVDTGRYRDSLVAFDSRLEGGQWVGSFGSTSYAWHFVEFGSVNNPPYGVLRQAAAYLGGKVEDL